MSETGDSGNELRGDGGSNGKEYPDTCPECGREMTRVEGSNISCLDCPFWATRSTYADDDDPWIRTDTGEYLSEDGGRNE